VMLLKFHIIWGVMLCLLSRPRSFEGTQCRHLQGQDFREGYSRWIVGYIRLVWVNQCTHCLLLKTEKTRNSRNVQNQSPDSTSPFKRNELIIRYDTELDKSSR